MRKSQTEERARLGALRSVLSMLRADAVELIVAAKNDVVGVELLSRLERSINLAATAVEMLDEDLGIEHRKGATK